MEQVTDRIWTETKVRGCNPSFVKTSAGPVVIDTPHLPTKAVAMRDEVEALFAGHPDGLGGLDDALLATVVVDQADFAHPDLLVSA